MQTRGAGAVVHGAKRLLPKRSPALKQLDTAIATWAKDGVGNRNANILDVFHKFNAWKVANDAEYQQIKAVADELDSYISVQYYEKPDQIIGVRATEVKPKGWRLVAYDPTVHGGTFLPRNQHVDPLTPAQIKRVNEAVARVKMAVHLARDTVVDLKRGGAFAPPYNHKQQLFVDFFGVYDSDRMDIIVENYWALTMSFDAIPNFVDVRNRTLWATTYGGCVRANLKVRHRGSIQAINGSVEMLVGRAFFGGKGYERTTDDTVTTLVHEFSHGTFGAADVPEVDGLGVFQCGRLSDDPNDFDYGHSQDPFAHQASQEEDDKLLARHKPDYAYVNADCYGQFAKRLLIGRQQ